MSKKLPYWLETEISLIPDSAGKSPYVLRKELLRRNNIHDLLPYFEEEADTPIYDVIPSGGSFFIYMNLTKISERTLFEMNDVHEVTWVDAVKKVKLLKIDKLKQIRDELYDKLAHSRRLNGVMITFDQSKCEFEIFNSYHEGLLDFFNNTSGHLSGVTEFDPVRRSRKTSDYSLIMEILEKIPPYLTPWYQVHKVGLDWAKKYFDHENRRLGQPLKEVQAVMREGLFLHPVQNYIVRRGIEFGGLFINGSDIGIGKTVITLSYIVAMGFKRVMVVCPKLGRSVWKTEAEKFFVDVFDIVKVEDFLAAQDSEPNKIKMILTHYEEFRSISTRHIRADLIVSDECHRFKNENTKTARAFFLTRDDFDFRVGLSGTLSTNKKEDVYTPLNWVRPNYITKEEIRFSTIGGFWAKINKDIYIRKSKSEMLNNLPPFYQKSIMTAAKFKFGKIKDIGAYQKFRVLSSLSIVPYSIEMALDILENTTDKLAITTEFIETSESLFAEFKKKSKIDCILLHGEVSYKDREERMHRFKTDPKCRTMISTRGVIAEALTFTVANHHIQNDLPWNAAKVEQIEGRFFRTGQVKDTYSYWMIANNPISISSINILHEKYVLTKAINEGKQLTKEQMKTLTEPMSFELFMEKCITED